MPARSSTPPRGHARVTARSASPVRGSASIRGVGSNNELVQAQAKSGRQLGSTWKELQDKDGKSYYHNAVKNTTQWEKPAGFDDSRSDLVHTSGSVKRRQKHIELEESADVMKMRKYRDRERKTLWGAAACCVLLAIILIALLIWGFTREEEAVPAVVGVVSATAVRTEIPRELNKTLAAETVVTASTPPPTPPPPPAVIIVTTPAPTIPPTASPTPVPTWLLNADDREKRINKTARILEQLHTNRCARVASCKCTKMACGASTAGFSCVEGTYGTPKVCAACGASGAATIGAGIHGQGRLVDLHHSTLQLSTGLTAQHKVAAASSSSAMCSLVTCNCDNLAGYRRSPLGLDGKYTCWESSQSIKLTPLCIAKCTNKTDWIDAPCGVYTPPVGSVSTLAKPSDRELKEQICYSKGLDEGWAQDYDPTDNHTIWSFYTGTAGPIRTFPGVSRERPSYSGSNPAGRCVNQVHLGTVGDLLYNKTCQDCVAAGYTCAACKRQGFNCSCACDKEVPRTTNVVNNAGYCSWSDPRSTSRYVAASTGPKDVVIVLDKSLSMVGTDGIVDETLGLTRLDVLKLAIKAVLDTLNEADYVNVATFSSKKDFKDSSADHCSDQHRHSSTAAGCHWTDKSGNPVYSTHQLLQATAANVSSLKAYVDSIVANGTSTFFNAGLDTAFDIFDKTIDGTKCAGQKVVLFMTDGNSEDEPGVLKFLHARNLKHQAKVFTYTIGALRDPLNPAQWIGPNSTHVTASNTWQTEQNAFKVNGGAQFVDPRLPQAMSCQTGARWTHINMPLCGDAGGEHAEMAKRLEREGAKAGQLSVSLMWNETDDLDLHCVEPSGEHIYYSHETSKDGAHLDVDMNAGGSLSTTPVENMYWDVEPKKGKYKFYFQNFRHRSGRSSIKYTAILRQAGQPPQLINGEWNTSMGTRKDVPLFSGFAFGQAVQPQTPQDPGSAAKAVGSSAALEAVAAVMSFYEFLAVNVEGTEVRWTPPFVDEITKKNVTAAMMPSYDRSGTSPKLIGITGQIIDMEHFGNTGTALGELLLRAKRCPSHATDWCEQERMRRDLSGYTCATMDDSPPIYNPLNLPTGTSWKEATTQRGPNLKEAGMFFHLVNNSNEDVHRPTNFGNGAGEGADPNQGAYESDANTFTIDFKQTYVTSKAHLSCSLSPAPSCASNPPMGTAVCASAAPTCQEKSSCCGRWSCSAGAAKCFSPCSPNPCGAHGTCSITLTGGEKCVCKNAYTGAKCQITPGCAGIYVNTTANPGGTYGTCFADGTLNAGSRCQLACDSDYKLAAAPGGSNLKSGEVSCENGSVSYYHSCIKEVCDGILAPSHGSLGTCTAGKCGKNCTIACDKDFVFVGVQPSCKNGALSYAGACKYDTAAATKPVLVERVEFAVTEPYQPAEPAVERLGVGADSLICAATLLLLMGMLLFYWHYKKTCIRELVLSPKAGHGVPVLVKGNARVDEFRKIIEAQLGPPPRSQVLSWGSNTLFHYDESSDEREMSRSLHEMGLRDGMTVSVVTVLDMGVKSKITRVTKSRSLPDDAAFEDARLKKMAMNVSQRGILSPKAEGFTKSAKIRGVKKVTDGGKMKPASFLDEFKAAAPIARAP